MTVYHKHGAPVPDKRILYYYFYFMQERMNIFWKKCDNHVLYLTEDPILKEYKFTNVYRACDRVSQYLINHVIYKDINRYTPEDVLLRILVFKIFNKIETWDYLERKYGDICIEHFDVGEICRLLSTRQIDGPIFNNAYIMTGSHHRYNYLPSKHAKWLQMVKDEFIGQGVVDKILGAIRGIKKCFLSIGDNYEDAIIYTYEHIDDFRKEFGLDSFKPLPGREPHLIDIQNCFCETDKYLRAKMPELLVGNVRIKQRYKETRQPIVYMFPPKWHININIQSRCTQRRTQESIPF